MALRACSCLQFTSGMKNGLAAIDTCISTAAQSLFTALYKRRPSHCSWPFINGGPFIVHGLSSTAGLLLSILPSLTLQILWFNHLVVTHEPTAASLSEQRTQGSQFSCVPCRPREAICRFAGSRDHLRAVFCRGKGPPFLQGHGTTPRREEWAIFAGPWDQAFCRGKGPPFLQGHGTTPLMRA